MCHVVAWKRRDRIKVLVTQCLNRNFGSVRSLLFYERKNQSICLLNKKWFFFLKIENKMPLLQGLVWSVALLYFTVRDQIFLWKGEARYIHMRDQVIQISKWRLHMTSCNLIHILLLHIHANSTFWVELKSHACFLECKIQFT